MTAKTIREAAKAEAWVDQLTDDSITDWVSYGSMSHTVHGLLVSIEATDSGVRITLDNGRTVVWRSSREFAKNVVRLYWERIVASLGEHVHCSYCGGRLETISAGIHPIEIDTLEDCRRVAVPNIQTIPEFQLS